MAIGERGKTIAILQSNYIPWKGYFDIIAAVDEFVIFDDVQFTRRDWRNRNKIVLGGKLQWLTIPVASKGIFDAPVNAMAIADRSWARKHWASIKHAYARAPYFSWMAPQLEAVYEEAATLSLLTDVNETFLRMLSGTLGLATTFSRSEAVPRVALDPTGRLVEICVAVGGKTYVSGPAAKSYINRGKFDAAGIELTYANYAGYPIYEQGMEPFEHGVSVLDVLFRHGPEARNHLKSLRRDGVFLDRAD